MRGDADEHRREVTERSIDIVGVLPGLALTGPLVPLIAAAIPANPQGGGPAPAARGSLARTGAAGAPAGPGRFRFAELSMLELRTMRLDAETLSGPVLAATNDPRVLPSDASCAGPSRKQRATRR